MNLEVELEGFVNNFPSNETRRAYKVDLERFSLYCSDLKKTLIEVTLSDLIRYRDLLKQTSSPNSVNRRISSIKSFYDWLYIKGTISNNPASALKALKTQVVKPTQAFSDEEVCEILNKTKSNKRNFLILSMLFELGLRRSELASLRVDDIYSSRNHTILRVRGKGSKTREIPLNSKLTSLIQEFVLAENKAPEDLLIGLGSSAIYKLVVSVAKSVGLSKRVSPHSCRATLISHLLEKGESPRNVANLAGHSSISTTVDIYDKKRDNIKNSSAFKVNYET